MNQGIKNIAEREFCNNEFIIGHKQIAGNVIKAGKWKEHIQRLKSVLEGKDE